MPEGDPQTGAGGIEKAPVKVAGRRTEHLPHLGFAITELHAGDALPDDDAGEGGWRYGQHAGSQQQAEGGGEARSSHGWGSFVAGALRAMPRGRTPPASLWGADAACTLASMAQVVQYAQGISRRAGVDRHVCLLVAVNPKPNAPTPSVPVSVPCVEQRN